MYKLIDSVKNIFRKPKKAPIHYYGVECKDILGKLYWRYYSHFNGSRGCWEDSPKKAINAGEMHAKLIKYVYPNLPANKKYSK